MALCFITPEDTIRAVAEFVGRGGRRLLLGEVVAAWVDDLPEDELVAHYAQALAELDNEDLSMLAAWHASLNLGEPIANVEFLVGIFPRLGDMRREVLKLAAGYKGEDDFDAGVSEEQALEAVLPHLSRESLEVLADECVALYMWDRLGGEN